MCWYGLRFKCVYFTKEKTNKLSLLLFQVIAAPLEGPTRTLIAFLVLKKEANDDVDDDDEDDDESCVEQQSWFVFSLFFPFFLFFLLFFLLCCRC